MFDVATMSNFVYARDDFSGVPSTPIAPVPTPSRWTSGDDGDDDDHGDDNGPAELRVYTIVDAAGNSEILTEKVKASGHHVHVNVVGFTYSTGRPTHCAFAPAALPPGTTKKFEWSVNRDGSLKELEQDMTIGRGRTRVHVKAKYDSKKNETTIQSEGRTASKATLGGLVLLRMATRSGAMVIEYTNPATSAVVVFP